VLIDTLKLIELTMSNPISRRVLQAGLSRTSNGSTRIECALDAFTGNRQSGYGICDRLYVLAIQGILHGGCRLFNFEANMLRHYARDPIVRRGIVSVLGGIARYGVTKPQLLNAPFLVVWNLTNLCNLRCQHCYQSAGAAAPNELELEEKIRVVRELADAGVVSVALSGGEPLIHPHFFSIVAEAKKNGMFVAVATNGIVIDECMAQRLKDVGVGYVEISLDSTRPELHDEFRGVSGSWKRTIEGIKNCVRVGLYTVIATTVTQLNVAEVADLIRLAKSLGAKRFTHFNFIPTGRAREILDLDLSPMEREELLKLLYQESKTIGIECLSTSPQYARVVLQNSKGEAVAPTHFYVGDGSGGDLQTLADFIGGCGCGRLYCAIQPNGDVTPCVFMPQSIVGNLRRSSFLEIWQESELLRRLRNREFLEAACGSCKYKLVCGGCRARAIGYIEDFAAPDPGCIYNQKAWTELHSFNASERQIAFTDIYVIRSGTGVYRQQGMVLGSSCVGAASFRETNTFSNSFGLEEPIDQRA